MLITFLVSLKMGVCRLDMSLVGGEGDGGDGQQGHINLSIYAYVRGCIFG